MNQTVAIQDLLDKQALHELVCRLSRGVDRCDRELIIDCYHPDAIDDHGPYKGDATGFADWVIPMIKGQWAQHTIYNELFDVRGDVAWGEIYVSQKMTGPDGRLLLAYGRYVDRYERRAGQWRIAHRQVITEHVPPELSLKLEDFVEGRQDRQDPCYQR